MPAKLTLFPTEGASRYFIFHEGRNHFVGRDPSGDIVLEDPRVSARHALFQWTGGSWNLVDLRSKNGTFVNGARITEIPLQDADWINLGGLLARYERVSQERLQQLDSDRGARLQAFLEARRDLVAGDHPQLLPRRVLQAALELASAERGFLLVWKSGGGLAAGVAAGFPAFEPVDERFASCLEAVERALQTDRPAVMSDARVEAAAGRRRSTLEASIRALACIPLRADGGVRGLLYVDRRKRGGVFTELDLEILEGLADHVAPEFSRSGIQGQIRELIGGPAEAAAGGNGGFLEELERRVGAIAGLILRRAPRLTPNT